MVDCVKKEILLLMLIVIFCDQIGMALLIFVFCIFFAADKMKIYSHEAMQQLSEGGKCSDLIYPQFPSCHYRKMSSISIIICMQFYSVVMHIYLLNAR